MRNLRKALIGGVSYSPIISLDFAAMASAGAADSRLTLTRSTPASIVDSTGRFTYAPNNMLTYSNDFSNAAWTKDGSTVAQGALAPDGTSTAWTMTETATTGLHRIYRQVLSSSETCLISSVYAKLGAGTAIYLSITATGGNAARATFNLSTGTVDSTNGATATMTSVGNGWYRCSAALNNGAAAWAGAFAAYGMGTTAAQSYDTTYLGTTGNTMLLCWGQFERTTYQSTPSTYKPTVASAYYAPRLTYDFFTGQPSGAIIEEQRQLLGLYTTNFRGGWTHNNMTGTPLDAASFDGLTNALRWEPTVTNTNTHYSTLAVNITSPATATNYCLSFFVKVTNTVPGISWWAQNLLVWILNTATADRVQANFNLLLNTFTAIAVGGTPWTNAAGGMQSYGNGWFRVWVSGTTPAYGSTFSLNVRLHPNTTLTYAGNGSYMHLWGAMLELGDRPSFPMLHYNNAAITRGADVLTGDATILAALKNPTQSVLAEMAPLAGGSVSGTSYGSSARRIVGFDRNNSPLMISPTAITAQSQIGFSSYADNANNDSGTQLIGAGGTANSINFGADPLRVGFAQSPAGRSIVTGGGAIASDGNVLDNSAATTAYLGSLNGSSSFLNGVLSKLAIYDKRLPDGKLAAKVGSTGAL